MAFDRYWMDWAPRKTVGQRRDEAAKMVRDASRRGKPLAPVVIEGRRIATTFWGKAWCDNIERYRDFAYRLERGRSYVRSGSVIDLAITPGRVKAQVLGSELHDVAVELAAVTPASWRAIQRDCAGSIGSLVDLLAGKLTEAVMARLCAEKTGLFPTPAEITIDCSCPDYASMCKHVAAVMYGVGARLDRSPEHLFTLRKVSADALVASVAEAAPIAGRGTTRSKRVLNADDGGLGALFGIELADDRAEEPAPRKRRVAAAKTARTTARGKKAVKTTKAPRSKPRTR